MNFLNSFLSSYSSHPPFSSSPSSSPVSPPEILRERRSARNIYLIFEILGEMTCAIITCIFVIVGLLIGAVVGLATESNLVRGAKVGAISAAAFFIQVVESSFALFDFRDSGIWSLLHVMNILSMQSTVQSQMSVASQPFMENPNFVEVGSMRGLSKDAVEKLPKIRINTKDDLDATGDTICCSVCLQDIQVGETVRSLPHCQHTFHLPCIDNWLIRHSSCPLCRGNI